MAVQVVAREDVRKVANIPVKLAVKTQPHQGQAIATNHGRRKGKASNFYSY